MVWFLDFQEALKRRVLVCFIKFSGTKFILCELCVPNMNLGPFIWYENIEIIIKDPFQSSWYWSYLAHFPAPSPKNKKKTHPKKISYVFRKKTFLIFWDEYWPSIKLKTVWSQRNSEKILKNAYIFQFPFKKKLQELIKMKKKLKKAIIYGIKFIHSARFMTSSLSTKCKLN